MNGLILSGGQSNRMGRPKGLLNYSSVARGFKSLATDDNGHDQPQIFHLAAMLKPVCSAVYLSCTPAQVSLFTNAGWQLPIITDDPAFGEIGPLNGLLSAFKAHKTGWIVVGCDYPFLVADDLEQLITSRNTACLATVFRQFQTNMPEPLIGIYEPAAEKALLQWLEDGNQSLRRFLEQHAAQFVRPDFPEHLKSVDTFEDYLKYRSA